MEMGVLLAYLFSAGVALLAGTYLASVVEKLKKAGKQLEEALGGLPTEILTFLIPLLSWLATLFYFPELTVEGIKDALTSGVIADAIAALTFIISAVMLLLAVAYYIRALLPSLIAVGGFLLGFFIIVFSIYAIAQGRAISVPALLFGALVLFASYVLGRLKLRR